MKKMISFYKFFIIFICMLVTTILDAENINHKQLNIGLLVVATGKYIKFVPPLIESARRHFCINHNVTYFIFTDGNAPQEKDVVSIYQQRLGWPFDTMMRIAMYDQAKELLKTQDYLFACDADMLFVDSVGDEIFGDLVGTLHPGYVGTQGTPEHSIRSTAYIKPGANKYYFAGGFNGGSREQFLRMAHIITENIKKDLERGIVAVWHDESHINKYFFDHEPTVILSPSYCYWEGKILPYHQRLVALNKNHEEFRA